MNDRLQVFEVIAGHGDAGQAAIRDGLGHPNWVIRKWRARYLDVHADQKGMKRLLLTLHDPHHKVRIWAVHALGCDQCKKTERLLDVVPHLADRLAEDKSLKVRRTAALMLAIQSEDRRARRALRRALRSETDDKLRRMADWGLTKFEQESAT